MKAFRKVIKRLFWSESPKEVVLTVDNEVTFDIKFGKLLVGTLVYSNDLWHFSYSDEFKSQKEILPLTNFPSKDKEYKAKELWPFFASRIPSNAQRQIDKQQSEDIVTLLKKFGRYTVSNPFELSVQ